MDRVKEGTRLVEEQRARRFAIESVPLSRVVRCRWCAACRGGELSVRGND